MKANEFHDKTSADPSISRRAFVASGTAAAVGAHAMRVSESEGADAVAGGVVGAAAYEGETGGRIYHLPRDHALHGGAWYRGAEYQETNYFTGFFTDKKTGRPYSVFFCWSIYGYDKQADRPLWVALFSMTDIERKKFAQCVHVMPGVITATGSGPNVPPADFFAQYAIGKGVDGSEGLFSYRNAGETWRYVSRVPTPSAKMPGDNRPYHLDLTAHVVKPGYQCPVPYGFTQEGLGTDVTSNLANPFTGAALSWYIIAPCMQMSGTLTCEDMDLELEGQAYYEHQWGRIRIPGMEQARYYWGWARMDDGRILNWRTYRDAKTSAYVPEDSANRFNVIHPDGRVQYFMGPAFRFEPTKSWKSPVTGVEYPLYGKMTTPVGVFYPEPVVDVAEAQLLNGGMWEGAARLRADRPDGPVVGRSFCEHMWAPFDSAVGKDIPYDKSITARRDADLPSGKDFKLYTRW